MTASHEPECPKRNTRRNDTESKSSGKGSRSIESLAPVAYQRGATLGLAASLWKHG